MAEFFAKGGTITRCPPGPSETVVYKNSYRRRPKPPSSDAAPTAQTAPAETPCIEESGIEISGIEDSGEEKADGAEEPDPV
ncbi:MAG: hypothetical protein K2Q10_07715 [Rhodospirillales bacterium]|nr:hypothetical protein [Rhodospirillales bacterium]